MSFLELLALYGFIVPTIPKDFLHITMELYTPFLEHEHEVIVEVIEFFHFPVSFCNHNNRGYPFDGYFSTYCECSIHLPKQTKIFSLSMPFRHKTSPGFLFFSSTVRIIDIDVLDLRRRNEDIFFDMIVNQNVMNL